LDERPANTRYPAMLAACAGIDLVQPPELSRRRTPANPVNIVQWLIAQQLDALIVSCEMLVYGGLTASRTSSDPTRAVLSRLEVLRDMKRRQPKLQIFGFNLITRIARSNDSTEEPFYWADYGASLFQLSQLMDRAQRGEAVTEAIDRLRAEIPPAHISDFLRRRFRNHQVNLATLGLLADGVLDVLVLSSDDTSDYGLATREKAWLMEQGARLELGDKLLMYPGADEVGCILLTRLINQMAGRAPIFQPHYLMPGGETVTAAFEDSAVQMTVERQVRAAGATINHDDGDIWLLVNPPLAPDADWPRAYTQDEMRERLPYIETSMAELVQRAGMGQRIAVADVAHANGGDVHLFDHLRPYLSQVDAYSAWNTAGNSLGTTIGHACAAFHYGREAAARFLAHRMIEDWAYQGIVRQEVSDWLLRECGGREPSPDRVELAEGWIEKRLSVLADGLALGFRIVPGSVRLPWGRTFEVDFALEPA
jgi:hypothetical protein